MSDNSTPEKNLLHLIVPGICGPLAETDSLQGNKELEKWMTMLSRSRQTVMPGSYTEVLKSVFRFKGSDIPSAALSMMADDHYDDSKYYLQADPVHLEADMDHAILTSAEDLNISDQECHDLLAALNQHFEQDALCFTAKDNRQWFVSSENKIDLNTTPLGDATGRNINFLLPTGDDASRWKQWLTEAQMLMFSHVVNENREHNRQLSINSLWFHGAGGISELKQAISDNGDIDSICSNQAMLKGLSEVLGTNYRPIPSSVGEYTDYLLANKDSSVNVLHLADLEHLVNYTDVSLWLEQLSALLKDWVYPVLKLAGQNNIKVRLYPCNNRQYLFSKHDGLRFWRHGKLEQHVDSY